MIINWVFESAWNISNTSKSTGAANSIEFSRWTISVRYTLIHYHNSTDCPLTCCFACFTPCRMVRRMHNNEKNITAQYWKVISRGIGTELRFVHRKSIKVHTTQQSIRLMANEIENRDSYSLQLNSLPQCVRIIVSKYGPLSIFVVVKIFFSFYFVFNSDAFALRFTWNEDGNICYFDVCMLRIFRTFARFL